MAKCGPPLTGPTSTIAEPPQDTEVTKDQINHVNSILETEEITEKQKFASIK